MAWPKGRAAWRGPTDRAECQAVDRAIVIGGPTASGKSSLACAVARRLGGAVVNADSMQLYRELRILTARPTPEDERTVEHRLYGVLPASEPASVARWLELIGEVLAELRSRRMPAVVVGGTGLYLEALLEGLAPVPDIPEEVRREARRLGTELGPAGLHDRLRELDPAMAGRLRRSDPQRIARAWEVVMATGRSLADWQTAREPPLLDPRCVVGMALMPPREALRARIGTRLRAMIDAGALAEVARLRDLDRALPLMKAVAVEELIGQLEGRHTLESAIDRAVTRTRQYAKRQATWFRHRLGALEPFAGFGDGADGVRACDRLLFRFHAASA